MSSIRIVEVERQWCEVIQQEAVMMEKRAYPSELLPDTEPYRVLSRQCSAGITCNLIGCTCRWAFTGPSVDRFALQS